MSQPTSSTMGEWEDMTEDRWPDWVIGVWLLGLLVVLGVGLGLTALGVPTGLATVLSVVLVGGLFAATWGRFDRRRTESLEDGDDDSSGPLGDGGRPTGR